MIEKFILVLFLFYYCELGVFFLKLVKRMMWSCSNNKKMCYVILGWVLYGRGNKLCE